MFCLLIVVGFRLIERFLWLPMGFACFDWCACLVFVACLRVCLFVLVLAVWLFCFGWFVCCCLGLFGLGFILLFRLPGYFGFWYVNWYWFGECYWLFSKLLNLIVRFDCLLLVWGWLVELWVWFLLFGFYWFELILVYFVGGVVFCWFARFDYFGFGCVTLICLRVCLCWLMLFWWWIFVGMFGGGLSFSWVLLVVVRICLVVVY